MDQINFDLKKALDTSVTSTGADLIPEVVSEGLRKFVVTLSPVYAVLPKKMWPSNAYMYREVNALASATFAADGAALPSASTGTYDEKVINVKYVYSRGEVTGPLIKAAQSFIDVLQAEIELHANAIVRQVEQRILTGDSTMNSAEFDGFVKQITLSKDAANAQLSLALLDEMLDLPISYPTHLIMTRPMGRRLWAIMQAQQRFISEVDIAGGFRVSTYNGLPVIRVDNAITGLTNIVLAPDMRWSSLIINQDITYEPLAKSKDSVDFMLKMYCALAVEGTNIFHAKLINVNP